jgi:hypothetical protein
MLDFPTDNKKANHGKNSWQRYFSLIEGKHLVGKQSDSYFQKKLGLYFRLVYKAEDLQTSH